MPGRPPLPESGGHSKVLMSNLLAGGVPLLLAQPPGGLALGAGMPITLANIGGSVARDGAALHGGLPANLQLALAGLPQLGAAGDPLPMPLPSLAGDAAAPLPPMPLPAVEHEQQQQEQREKEQQQLAGAAAEMAAAAQPLGGDSLPLSSLQAAMPGLMPPPPSGEIAAHG